jgi:hypothetical protein
MLMSAPHVYSVRYRFYCCHEVNIAGIERGDSKNNSVYNHDLNMVRLMLCVRFGHFSGICEFGER